MNGPISLQSVQSLSHVGLLTTPQTAASQASLSITNSQLFKLMSIESVMPSSHLILCSPPLLLPSITPSIRVFQMSHYFAPGGQSTGVSALASVLPNEYSGLTSFRMDRLDLLAVQGTLKSLLQHHSSKASILRCSAFFTIFQNSQVQFTYLVNLRCFHISKIKALHTSTMYLYSLNLKLKSSHLLWN